MAAMRVLLAALVPGVASVTLGNLRTEYLESPLGLDAPRPRFTWELHPSDAAERGLAQSSYQLTVAAKGAAADAAVWDSGAVASNASYLVKYTGPALKSGTVYHWSVTCATTDVAGAKGSATSGGVFSMGMLTPEAWGASFIGVPRANSTAVAKGPAPTGPVLPAEDPWFRKTFSLPPAATGDALIYVPTPSGGVWGVYRSHQSPSIYHCFWSISDRFIPRSRWRASATTNSPW